MHPDLVSDRPAELKPSEPAALTQLERLLAPTQETTIDCAAGEGDPQWLHAGNWRLLVRPRLRPPQGGIEIERFLLKDGSSISALMPELGRPWLPFDLDDAYQSYVNERWRRTVNLRALSRRQLAFYYFAKPLIPRSLQLLARRWLARFQGSTPFPAWPLDDSVHTLLRFYAHCRLLALNVESENFRWFWPRNHTAAAILTHDVETEEGLRLSLDLAALEEERGLRSSFNIVAAWYPIDHGILRELRCRGFEVGLHGLRHDRSLFVSRERFEEQLPNVAAAANLIGAVGFRSPSTHRVNDWLSDLPVSYDCSVPHSDPYEPQPGGCCTIWPFFAGQVVELPYTLPQDHTLLTLLRQKSSDLWLRQIDQIEQRHGLIQCLSHPDPGYLATPDHRAVYAELLDALAERTHLWKPLPRDLAAWWRHRDRNTVDSTIALGTVRRTDQPYALFEPPPLTAHDLRRTD